PETLVLPLHDGRALVDGDGRLALVPPAVVEEALAKGREGDPLRLYLGRVRPTEGIPDDGILVDGGDAEVDPIPVLAALITSRSADHLALGDWMDLRAASIKLNPQDAGLLTRAVALANWHVSHRFSPRTGRETTPVQGGWVRKDPS